MEHGQRHQKGHDPWVAEFQPRRFFTVFGLGRLHHTLDAVAAQATVLADAFDFQQAPVNLSANLLQVRQIAQAFIHSKVTWLAKDALRPATAAFFKVLLQFEILVFDVQTGMDPILNYTCAEVPRSFLCYDSIEDQLYAVGPPQVQIVANDLLEELTPP